MTSLWDTKGIAVVKALANERRSAGGLASGLALTLVAVVDEGQVREAEAAATIAASAHPCRLLLIVRADVTQQRSRLDAEIVVGGRLGPCEAVVMRMQGRLALHAESVVMPLLAPDVPVVTWWQCPAPERIAYDPLGVVADRRITDSAQAENPVAALRIRAEDYAPGDTDLAWTRVTPWRALLAGAFDAHRPGGGTAVTAATITAPPTDPTAAMLGGWLTTRMGVSPTIQAGTGKIMEAIALEFADGTLVELIRDLSNGTAIMRRSGHPDQMLPLARRPLGEELAEELRRLDADQVYAAALGAAFGQVGLDHRPGTRFHVWKDPALSEQPEKVGAPW